MARPRKDPTLIILTPDKIGEFRQNVMALADNLVSNALRVDTTPQVSHKRGRKPNTGQVQNQQVQ